MSETITDGHKILVVDDDAAVVDYLCESLRPTGYEVVGITSAREALARLESASFDLLISDVEMPELRGVELLEAILAVKPNQLVLLISAYGSVEMAMAAVRAGACDFLTKPFKIEALLLAIQRALTERMLKREVVRLRSAIAQLDTSRRIVAKSAVMRRVLDLARRVAGTNTSVLITGETGSGKSLLARFIHEQSGRREGPLVELNCAALPAQLAESELFGARRGAFTDAREDREGLFVTARDGTLFLDEIGELSLETQAKLLHVLETGRLRPLGASVETPTNARIIAATNRAPEQLVRDGKLRLDLYYRINVVRIEVPPLRERREDLVPLVDNLLAQAIDRQGRPMIGISAKAIKLLVRHEWPGNVRELANAIERAVAIAEHDTILAEDIGLPSADDPQSTLTLDKALARGLTLEEVERAYVRQVVDAHEGNKTAAARLLGITRKTLYRKLGLEPPRSRPDEPEDIDEP